MSSKHTQRFDPRNGHAAFPDPDCLSERIRRGNDTPADAQLANAAPDLLAAAKECLRDLEHYASTHGPGPDRRLAALRSAIARAEGGEA